MPCRACVSVDPLGGPVLFACLYGQCRPVYAILQAMNNNNFTTFFLLAGLLIGFIVIVTTLGYIWALVFCAIAAGFVLWWSRHKQPGRGEEE